MTKKEQRRIIRELTATVRERMLNYSGRLPATWDGIELRQWMADIVNNDVNYKKMTGSRMKDYRSEWLNRNL